MRPRRSPQASGLLVRVAVGAAASLAVVATGATGAVAEDATSTDEVDPSTQVLETEVPTGDLGTSDSSDVPAQESETPAGTDAEADADADADVEGETEVDGETAGAVPTAETGEDTDEVADPAVQAAVAPLYGSQKIRIGVQQADGSYLPEGTSFAGTTMSITLSGGTLPDGGPRPDASTTCTVPAESTVCVPAAFTTNGSNLRLEAGQTAVVTPTSVPAGLVIAPASQTVLPELCPFINGTDEQVCIPSDTKNLDFDVSAVPETISASTTEGQPVAIDVVAPLDLAPDNGVTGVTVTSQSTNGTAVVNGDLPPVVEQPVDSGDITAPVAAAVPVAEAAPSGTSRIVFTPNAGFVGTTTFGYAVATQDGTITGVATITVNAAPVVTPPAAPAGAGTIGTASRIRSSADGTLPSTGGPAADLLGLGALLVVAGAGAMVVRRRQGHELVG